MCVLYTYTYIHMKVIDIREMVCLVPRCNHGVIVNYVGVIIYIDACYTNCERNYYIPSYP